MGVDTFGKPFFMGLQQCLHMARMHACEHQQFYSGWSMILFQSLSSTHRHPLYYATITFSPFTLEGEKKGVWGLEGGSQVPKKGALMLLLFGGPDLDMWVFLCVAQCWKSCMSVALCGIASRRIWLGRPILHLPAHWDVDASECLLVCGWGSKMCEMHKPCRETLREGKRCTSKDTSRDEVSKIQKESHKENRGSTCKEDELTKHREKANHKDMEVQWCGKRSGES